MIVCITQPSARNDEDIQTFKRYICNKFGFDQYFGEKLT